MLHLKRGNALGKQLRLFSLCRGRLLFTELYNQLPGDLRSWRVPGDSTAAHEQIWIDLHKVFQDEGITLWPNAFSFVLRIADYPSSSGFGYVIPTCKKHGIGSLKNLRHYNYHVCSFICLFNPCLISIDRMHSRELHVPKMD